MEKLTIEDAIKKVETIMLAHREERATGAPPSAEAVAALKAELLESWPTPGDVRTVVTTSRLDAVRRAEEAGCAREDLIMVGAAGDISVQYDGCGAATSNYAVGGALVSHYTGEYDLGKNLAGLERLAALVNGEIAGSIFLCAGSSPEKPVRLRKVQPLLLVIPLPNREIRDELHRLHCADGPSISYHDEDQWHWHGLPVPRDVIMRDEWTPQEIQALPTTEIRRALAERLGADRVLQMLECIDVDTWIAPNGDCYRLVDAPIVQKRYLVMISPTLNDGSRPTYVESVALECTTAAGARLWRVSDLSPESCDAGADLTYAEER